MVLIVKHEFVSGKGDGVDTSQVQPSNWNAAHTLSGSLATAQVDGLDAALATIVISNSVSIMIAAQNTEWVTSASIATRIGTANAEWVTSNSISSRIVTATAEFLSSNSISIAIAEFVTSNSISTRTVTALAPYKTSNSISLAVTTESLSVLGTASFSGTAVFKTNVRFDAASISVSVAQTIFYPAGSMIPTTTAGATYEELEQSTTSSAAIMSSAMLFATDANDHAQFSVLTPKSWNAGTVTAQVVWDTITATVSNTVVFYLQGVSFANGDDTVTAFGTAQKMQDSVSGAFKVHMTPESPAITIAGTPAAEEWVVFQLYRDTVDAADDLAYNARVKGVRIKYNITQLGDD